MIGCSEYSGGIAALPGAFNDVHRFEELLTGEFRFTDVTALAGTSDEDRPTAAAIGSAFQSLIRRTQAGDQIFVLLSGHGTQFPVPEEQTDLLAESNPEPDGFDEVFLAADYQNGSNFIRDDQFGHWLDELRSKPANVWIIFDCCFSGTMTRGADPSQNVTRGLRPIDAGVSETDIDRALELAKPFRQPSHGPCSPLHGQWSAHRNRGSLVAFYACQPFETAKEVYRPETLPRSDDLRTGLLSYHVLRSLRQCGEQISYRDLSRMVVSGIRSEMGSDGPTPMFEGDIEQRVLGLNEWPDTGLYLDEMIDGYWRVSGGCLAGLTEQTLMALYPLNASSGTQPVGYVRVVSVATSAAAVVPVKYGDKEPFVPADQDLPLRCRVMTDGRMAPVSLGVLPLAPAHTVTLSRIAKDLETADPDRVRIADVEEAEYILTFATPEQAQTNFGYQTQKSGYLLAERRTTRAALPGNVQLKVIGGL
ncbi:MAG: caspase family protein [Planctomycetaceae bacterium]